MPKERKIKDEWFSWFFEVDDWEAYYGFGTNQGIYRNNDWEFISYYQRLSIILKGKIGELPDRLKISEAKDIELKIYSRYDLNEDKERSFIGLIDDMKDCIRINLFLPKEACDFILGMLNSNKVRYAVLSSNKLRYKSGIVTRFNLLTNLDPDEF
ncbi:MAG: hypothetical protein N4A44_04630 [Alphaproteobacteria bacterium]|jgi:hypothetical protein|nr:hypothetical protein [Alphaproteobacteria bacterium]